MAVAALSRRGALPWGPRPPLLFTAIQLQVNRRRDGLSARAYCTITSTVGLSAFSRWVFCSSHPLTIDPKGKIPLLIPSRGSLSLRLLLLVSLG